MNKPPPPNLGDALETLHATVMSRQGAAPESSYAASLFAKGLDKILKKVGEESAEVLIAAKGDNRADLVHEIVDLVYHLTVLMVDQGISTDDLAVEIDRRRGKSGLEEKASRPK